MYWGQIGFSLASSLAICYVAFRGGYSGISTLFVGLISYILIRWVLEWLHRTLYWYTSEARDSRRCESCGRKRTRDSREWFVECATCDWQPGRPVLRWVTHSVPAVQFRRTVYSPRAVVLIFAAGLVLSGATAGLAVTDVTGDLSAGAFGTEDEPESTPTRHIISPGESTPTPEATSSTPTPVPQPWYLIEEEEIEERVVELINEERRERGYEELESLDSLQAVAENHSQDMHDRGFYSHNNPDGESPSDRGEDIERCHTRGQPTIAENIHQGAVREKQRSVGSPNSFDTRTAEGIANYIVDGWMHSDGHREIILTFGLEYTGVGVRIEDGDFFATANFC